ncbi:hypothetical protein SSX86_011114 [Deinandra increscens subsp. villosa]|uniref:CoA carboxyltransferase N-terminal domain-containing protein n=1 Tax=Deinandra increscens subsp. villosa TaxID=3103831 RepID=A0AAP0DDS0_9ASTR
MKRWWFNSMLFKKEFEHRCRLSKSTSSLGPIENASESKDPNINDTDKNIQSCGGHDNYRNVDLFFGVKDIRNFISDDTFLVKDSNGDIFSIYFDIENHIFEIYNDHPFCSELESSFYRNSSYLNNGSKSKNPQHDPYMNDTQYTWNNHINSCIDSYLQSQICIDSYIVSGSDNSSKNYISSSICSKSGNSSKNADARKMIRESSTDLDVNQKYRHLWVQCENCYGLNYKKFFQSKMNLCEQCGYHLKMSSSDRIELSIDPGTWQPMDEDMVSLDPIEFHSEEEPYKNRIDSYQRKTGLTEAVQTGIGQLDGINVAIAVMDFQFMGGDIEGDEASKPTIGHKETLEIHHLRRKGKLRADHEVVLALKRKFEEEIFEKRDSSKITPLRLTAKFKKKPKNRRKHKRMASNKTEEGMDKEGIDRSDVVEPPSPTSASDEMVIATETEEFGTPTEQTVLHDEENDNFMTANEFENSSVLKPTVRKSGRLAVKALGTFTNTVDNPVDVENDESLVKGKRALAGENNSDVGEINKDSKRRRNKGKTADEPVIVDTDDSGVKTRSRSKGKRMLVDESTSDDDVDKGNPKKRIKKGLERKVKTELVKKGKQANQVDAGKKGKDSSGVKKEVGKKGKKGKKQFTRRTGKNW